MIFIPKTYQNNKLIYIFKYTKLLNSKKNQTILITKKPYLFNHKPLIKFLKVFFNTKITKFIIY